MIEKKAPAPTARGALTAGVFVLLMSAVVALYVMLVLRADDATVEYLLAR